MTNAPSTQRQQSWCVRCVKWRRRSFYYFYIRINSAKLCGSKQRDYVHLYGAVAGMHSHGHTNAIKLTRNAAVNFYSTNNKIEKSPLSAVRIKIFLFFISRTHSCSVMAELSYSVVCCCLWLGSDINIQNWRNKLLLLRWMCSGLVQSWTGR